MKLANVRYSGSPILYNPAMPNLGRVRSGNTRRQLRGMGDGEIPYLDTSAVDNSAFGTYTPVSTVSAPVAPSADASTSGFNWNSAFNTLATAATAIYGSATAANIARTQAKTQAQYGYNPLLRGNPLINTGNYGGVFPSLGTQSSMMPLLILGGLGVVAFLIMKN